MSKYENVFNINDYHWCRQYTNELRHFHILYIGVARHIFTEDIWNKTHEYNYYSSMLKSPF